MRYNRYSVQGCHERRWPIVPSFCSGIVALYYYFLILLKLLNWNFTFSFFFKLCHCFAFFYYYFLIKCGYNEPYINKSVYPTYWVVNTEDRYAKYVCNWINILHIGCRANKTFLNHLYRLIQKCIYSFGLYFGLIN